MRGAKTEDHYQMCDFTLHIGDGYVKQGLPDHELKAYYAVLKQNYKVLGIGDSLHLSVVELDEDSEVWHAQPNE